MKLWMAEWKIVGERGDSGGLAIRGCNGKRWDTLLEQSNFAFDADVILAAAAPAMARALCLAETSYGEGDYYCTAYQSCGVCAKPIAYTIEDGKHVAIIQHKPACPLDAALTAAGLSPEDREQVRKAMR